MSFLLDTCFVSELVKPRRDPGVLEWLERQDEESLFLSSITLGELEKGLAKIGDEVRRRRLRRQLEVEILSRFQERMLETDVAVWRRWGQLCGAAERTGKPLPGLDALLAATAQVHGLTVVTRNEAHFVTANVATFNPWTGRTNEG